MLLPFALLFFFLLMLLPLDHVMPASDEQRYSTCSNVKRCGGFNITYPFWEFGGETEDFCGHPGYGVKCKEGNLTFSIGDDFYQILDMIMENQSLIIVREDVLHNICPEPRNSFDLDPHYFSLTDHDWDATLLFNCSQPLPPQQLHHQLHCSYSHGDYLLTNLTTRDDDPMLNSSCQDSLTIPMLQSAAQQLADNRIEAAVALEKGFEVKWTLDGAECLACLNSSGACGYTNSLSQFSCFCTDGPHKGTCSGPPQPQSPPEKTSWKVKFGIAVVAVGGTAIVMSLVFFFYTRYRRNQKPTSYVVSRSISSHYSSRMDCEREGEYYGLPIFEYDELRSATNNFDPEKELGDGGFGTVFHGKLKDGRVVAVKRLYEHNYKRTEQFINEVEILARLHHPNLVRLYGCTSRMSNRLLLVYEYVPNGTVADHLHGDLAKPGSLPWSIRMNIAIETASALVYLHASEIIHRDVKTNNILLDENFKVKVADFGLSRLFPLNATHVSTAPQGTPGYVDPEYHECYQLTEKSDVYSFGVVLMELISSLPAVDIMRHRHEINLSTMAINKIQNDAIHELVDKNLGFGSDYDVTRMIMAVAELGFLCLQNGKDMRPSMVEVLEVLQNIQKEDTGADKIKDVHSDVVALLKVNTSSPVSVASKWVSSENTTPNSSG